MAFNLTRGSTHILKKCFQTKFFNYKNVAHLDKRNLHLSPILQRIISFNLSDIGEGIREVTVKEWFVKVGDTVEQFQNICEVQSDKASVTITSRYDGKIVKLYHKVDEIALVGRPLVDFDIDDEDHEGSESSEESSTSGSESDKEKGSLSDTDHHHHHHRHKILATPAVRRIAMENNVDLNKVPATGKLGRVLKGDIMEYLGMVPQGTNKPHPTLLQKQQVVGTRVPAPDRIEALKGVRKVMLKTMSESLKIPHFAYCDEINMNKLIDFRDQLQELAQERGVPKLTFMPFFVKAASVGLTKFPILNSVLDVENEKVMLKGPHNISVAIATPQGLVVPNVKNCQSKTILEIAKDFNDLVERGRTGHLHPPDFADGTFTLSNIGNVGGTYTHPCIMPPQVAIGAMGKTQVLPRFGANDEIVKVNIMNISWCADHRVIDGVTMANFSNTWKKYLENPALFLLTDEQ
ncbi:lipoamide acyltransferase component of branched-chain alpha-keto acid dehydrogenase complex, mitochondrial [Condylostylus longicornis]|uniref:lipoamide acyltransferase component of branched-chain alpha-keto acid dehydrogenase complex, mitochondrial n=1 Tax=Condylostylus longicornis TaxID=2530218 RepID=UPI00244DFB98|nr:lipoamide acyltransferase component of branched-chain alpha-keto acid dehydrogenase complex, mitochondrial [Condylostylus longicornis]